MIQNFNFILKFLLIALSKKYIISTKLKSKEKTINMLEWTSRPTKIDNWEKGLDYVMFVDENGNSDIKDILKCIAKGQTVDINDRFFTVTGVIFTKQQYIIAKNKLNELKEKYWKNGVYLYKDTYKKVCFHSREIRRKSGAFDIHLIDYNSFMEDLSKLIKDLEYKIISITIDKEEYLLKHYQFNVYNTAMCFLLQRYIYILPNNCKGSIMLEARGKDEDYILLNEMKHIIFETGIKRISSDELQNKIAGIYFNPKWNKKYDDTFSGLEVADLSSYPIHKFVRNKNKDKAFTILENKIDKYPNYMNKGIKIFP